MKTAKKFFHIVFLLLVLQFALPQDLLHLVSGHSDTVDLVQTQPGRLNLENEHQHCLSLQLTIPPFLSALHFSCAFFSSAENQHLFFLEENFFSSFLEEHPVRGPPAIA